MPFLFSGISGQAYDLVCDEIGMQPIVTNRAGYSQFIQAFFYGFPLGMPCDKFIATVITFGIEFFDRGLLGFHRPGPFSAGGLPGVTGKSVGDRSQPQ